MGPAIDGDGGDVAPRIETAVAKRAGHLIADVSFEHFKRGIEQIEAACALLAPDVYLSGNDRVLKVLSLYGNAGNALFVPEAGLNAVNAKYLYEVLSRGGIGFSPFGIDNNGDTSVNNSLQQTLLPYANEYALATTMQNELAAWSRDGKIMCAVEGDDHAAQTVNLGAWQAMVSFGNHRRANLLNANAEATGKVMFIQTKENEFLVTGSQCHITFRPSGNDAAKAWQYLSVEEGAYEKGSFVPARILNGDETDWGGPGFGETPALLRVRVTTR